VTLIREYAQGPNALAYCLPTGGLDPKRHADLQDCAARELSEEVRQCFDIVLLLFLS
jgi:ADP-ribose pyrophosphatase YjhB (NUDIX family)